MPIEVKKIYPLDLQESTAVGVDLPFSSTAVFNSTYETKDAIKVNLINYFLTNKGERYMNPSFGSDIRTLLFENINEDILEELRDIVSRDLSRFFPRVLPIKIDLTAEPDSNTVNFYLRYQISDTNIEDELLINIEQ